MFRLKSLILFTTLLFPFFLYSQQDKNIFDFSMVDSIARTVKYKKDIYLLTKELTNPYSDQLYKVRAIFVWITDNISYNYKYYNKYYNKGKEPKTPKCKTGMNCEQLLIDWENNYVRKVLKKKKGVCDGYSKLFKKMCDIAGIKSEIVSGYTKTKLNQIGNTGSVNHSWNVVWIDSAYYLLDATWAAGSCIEDGNTGELLDFKKDFDNYYWFTPFNDFARNHYPQNGKWVFEPNYTKEKFAANPYYAPYTLSQLKLLTPLSGIINAKKGDTIHFAFDYKDYIGYLQVNSNVFKNPEIWKWEKISKRRKIWKEDTTALKKQKYISFKKNGNRYEFDYIVTDNSLYYLDILFDYDRVMRFKVNIVKQDL